MCLCVSLTTLPSNFILGILFSSENSVFIQLRKININWFQLRNSPPYTAIVILHFTLRWSKQTEDNVKEPCREFSSI